MLWRKRKTGTGKIETPKVGLSIGLGEASVVYTDGEIDGRPHVVAWESFPYETHADIQDGLSRFVGAHGLHGEACRCTLSPNDYSLRLVERPPNVPDEELVDATRWLIRDLIEFDVEQASLAILTIPEDAGRARTPRMFVVAAREESVLNLANAITEAGLKVLGFEIIESAMLALQERLPEIVTGGAMLRLEDKASIMTLARDRHLYLARNLHVGLDTLDDAAQRALSADDPADSSIIECLDPLLLDVQRSLDYYESEFSQAPCSRIALLPSAVDTTPLIPALSEALRPIQIVSVELEREFDFESIPPADLQQSMMFAASASLSEADILGAKLLPLSFRSEEAEFGLARVLVAASAVAIFLCAYYGFSLYQFTQVQGVVSDLEARRDLIQGEIDAYREQAAASSGTTDPEAEIEALTALRNARISMLRDMTQRASRSDASFSNLLGALARQDAEGIWLERIEFANGGDAITLEGRTLAPDRIPNYLRNLGTEQSFASRRFRAFRLDRTDSTHPGLAFRIATESDSSRSGEESQ